MCHWNDLNGDQMATRTNSKSQTTPATGTDALGYERELFAMADKLRGNMEPSDYKHVALGLIFLKYISESFEALHAKLLEEDPDFAEERDEYIAENVFWVPKNARWSYLKDNAKSERIEIGRASCRERVESSALAASIAVREEDHRGVQR